MSRKAKVMYKDEWAGILSETESGYEFKYLESYMEDEKAIGISLTLPLREQSFTSQVMFPFFDGLIPEGWLLEIAYKHWKIDNRDRMGLLLTCCKDCIGAVSLIPISNDE